MGYEYKFIITEQDLDNLSRNPDAINTVEKILTDAPGFYQQSDKTFYYSETPENDKRWPSTIFLNESGFCLCIYQRINNSLDQQLLNYLMQELLNRCGRLQIEDA